MPPHPLDSEALMSQLRRQLLSLKASLRVRQMTLHAIECVGRRRQAFMLKLFPFFQELLQL